MEIAKSCHLPPHSGGVGGSVEEVEGGRGREVRGEDGQTHPAAEWRRGETQRRPLPGDDAGEGAGGACLAAEGDLGEALASARVAAAKASVPGSLSVRCTRSTVSMCERVNSRRYFST